MMIWMVKMYTFNKIYIQQKEKQIKRNDERGRARGDAHKEQEKRAPNPN